MWLFRSDGPGNLLKFLSVNFFRFEEVRADILLVISAIIRIAHDDSKIVPFQLDELDESSALSLCLLGYLEHRETIAHPVWKRKN